MDFKEPGNLLYLLGVTRPEFGGSHYRLVHGLGGGDVPQVDLELAPKVFRKVHEAIGRGLVRACHDLSEGGLAAALAEMAFAGGVGADVTGLDATLPDAAWLFAESPTRFVLETTPRRAEELERCLGGEVPWRRLGGTVREPRLRIAGARGEWVVWASLADLKEAWHKPLRW
jgi:phosphoribosylformylglycinamidine synthase